MVQRRSSKLVGRNLPLTLKGLARVLCHQPLSHSQVPSDVDRMSAERSLFCLLRCFRELEKQELRATVVGKMCGFQQPACIRQASCVWYIGHRVNEFGRADRLGHLTLRRYAP